MRCGVYVDIHKEEEGEVAGIESAVKCHLLDIYVDVYYLSRAYPYAYGIAYQLLIGR